MNEAEFARLVSLGLGRAVIYLHENDPAPYRTIVLDACLHCKSFDPQVEGMHAAYALDLAETFSEFETISESIISTLTDTNDTWDIAHRFAVARLLAEREFPGARSAMYEKFDSADRDIRDMVAAEIVVLDGLDGLLFVADRIGARLAANPKDWQDPYLLSVAAEEAGNDEVKECLQRAAKENTNIRAFVLAIQANSSQMAPTAKTVDPNGLTYRELRSLIASEMKRYSYVPVKWGESASDDELRKAAAELETVEDPLTLFLMLKIFWRRPFPANHHILISLLSHPDDRVQFGAARALEQVTHEDVRQVALDLFESGSGHRTSSLDILVNNFREGDHAVVEQWCAQERDPQALHHTFLHCDLFYKAHPDTQSEIRLLNCLYEKQPCSHCRDYHIERLIELEALSDPMRLECQWDCNDDVRQRVKHLPQNLSDLTCHKRD